MYLSSPVSIHPSILYIYIHFYPSIYPFLIHASIHIYIHSHIYLATHISIHLSSQPQAPSIHPFIHLSCFYLSHPSIPLLIHYFTPLSIHPFIHPLIYPSTIHHPAISLPTNPSVYLPPLTYPPNRYLSMVVSWQAPSERITRRQGEVYIN